MKEQVEWFGRYLGCYSVHIWSDGVPDSASKLKILSCTWFSIANRKLILKELKDISDEDLKELNCLISEFGGWSVYELSLNDILFYDKEIDFLRSKGYAIGIPKEYYITESELNN